MHQSPRGRASSADIFEFARKAAAALRKSTLLLAGQRGDRDKCSSLDVQLSYVEERLSQPDGVDINDIFQLLHSFELLSCPLSKPCHRPKDVTIGTFRRHYPFLQKLTSSHHNGINANIREVATSRNVKATERRKKISKSLEDFIKTEDSLEAKVGLRGQGLDKFAAATKIKVNTEDYSSHLDNLYSTLRTYCVCPLLEGSYISVILGLKDWQKTSRATGVEDGVCFNLLLLVHPHRNENAGEGCEWQDISICVTLSGEPCARTEIKEMFCSWISKLHQARCRTLVIASNGALHHREERNELVSGRFLLSCSSVSLATLLDGHLLVNVRQKTLLSYLLVKAICDFYYTEWMTKEWSKHSIHFMFQTYGSLPIQEVQDAQPRAVCFSEPFIEADFGSSPPAEPGNSQFQTRTHPYPKILALGILLLEIELGRQIETRLEPNADHIAAIRLLDSEDWKDTGTYQFTKDVIEICVKPDRDILGTDPYNLRNVLDQKFIQPCREAFKSLWSEDPDTSPMALRYGDRDRNARLGQVSASPVQNTAGDQGQHGSTTPRPRIWHGTPTEDSRYAVLSSDAWFTELDELSRVLDPPSGCGNLIPIKIAILDTGIRQECEKRVPPERYRDFVRPGQKSCEDKCGHGTTMFELLSKVYDEAEIYIGRVFEYTDGDERTAEMMAEAIDYAVKQWRVDVIALPSGFRNEYPKISKAISQANNENILIFAAPGNHGNEREIAFPGCLYTAVKVLCMFSTTSEGKPNPIFNPASIPTHRFNLAIFGKDVVVQSRRGTDVIEGTSASTVIGAGLAGRILAFAQQPDCQERIPLAAYLRDVDGMSSVFRAMSILDNNYSCVRPRLLVPRWARELSIMKKRENVCFNILTALDQRSQ